MRDAGQAASDAAIHKAKPRMIRTVHAVLRNAVSSPRWFCTIDGVVPTSLNICSPVMTTLTSAIRPNALGNKRRVKIRFEASCRTRPEP